jgi:phosphatidylserine/phosphatidylglycerophosphate/cardiolipin synthase-like enzyme
VAPDPTKWLLTFNFPDGKPWGTDTKMAARAQTPGANPWDVNCEVTPLIGGYRAMCEMRDALEQLILDAKSSPKPAGEKGHVYIADWRLNCLRDLSDQNPWQTHAWGPPNLAQYKDQTAIGTVLRLMQAGVAVRILVWLPTPAQSLPAGLQAHVQDHVYLANIVAEENKRLNQTLTPTVPLGIVGLDARTADGAIAGSHHQKMMVIRSPGLNVAFCGGVDLAFTRRDAPANPANFDPIAFLDGDWETGSTIPDLKPIYPKGMIWPPDGNTEYASAIKASPPGAKQSSDLALQTNDNKDVCSAIGGTWDPATQTCTYTAYPKAGPSTGVAGTVQPIYGMTNQMWHDQHLMLKGPIVSTLESQFAERWVDSAHVDVLTLVDWFRGLVLFSTAKAYDATSKPFSIVPLPDPIDVAPGATGSTVQMWRTIPMRDSRTSPLFRDGEFTVMSGYAKAISAAQELIWIFDQYFWSEPAARLLNHRIQTTQNLCVLLILPPFADSTYPTIHRARQLALAQLVHGLDANQSVRVGVYNLWQPANHDPAKGRGIYVHAKTHTYDGTLLVCGSANMNRRSLTCDTELACAVLDPAVVARHQQNLWHLLFGNVAGAPGAWPALDLNSQGNGVQFFQKFQAAAASGDAFVVPDPWDDSNPTKTPPKPVALPNGVPRQMEFPGPIYEIIYGEALDPGSLDRAVEQDVIETPNPPRPPRLDDVVYRIEKYTTSLPGGSLRFPKRQQATLLRGSVITWPGIVYTEGRYEFTENAEWWKQMCLGFPCFTQFPMHWPDYDTTIVNANIDGHDVVIQLWKGWCEQFATLKGMPGGIGAEVGVYRRVPSSELPIPKSLPRQLGLYGDLVIRALNGLNDTQFWWPFPELNSKITFTLKRPDGNAFFTTKPEDTWWACKWMDNRSYDRYKTDSPPTPSMSTSYLLDWTIATKTSSKSGTW